MWSPAPGSYVEPTTRTRYLVVGNAAGVLLYWVPQRRVPTRVWQRVGERTAEAARRAGQVAQEQARQIAAETEALVASETALEGAQTAFAVAVITGAMVAGLMALSSFTARVAF